MRHLSKDIFFNKLCGRISLTLRFRQRYLCADHGGMSDGIVLSRGSEDNLLFEGDFTNEEITALDFIFFPHKNVENAGNFWIRNLYQKAFLYENTEEEETLSSHQTMATVNKYLFSFLVLAISFIS